jgi:predicted  nucleic acid-binding Zn-ribbon protein
MTQAITSADLTVAALQESVRHNEKNIDKLDRDLKDFRSEVLREFEKVDQRFDKVDQRFSKVDDRFNQLETKVNDRFNQITMLLIAIVGLIIALLVKLVIFN